ncbi:hypothetical protein EJB05_11372, partial [Eragrostis curvula]
MAIADTAATKLLHGSGGGGAAVARGVAAAGTFGFGLDGLGQLISGFFANIFASLLAALAGAAHLLVLPFEALWRLLLAAVAGAAGAISGLWHLVAGFFANIFAAVAGAAHQLVLPLEALWRWILAAGASAAGAISGLWHLVAGFFPHLFASLAGAAHDVAQHLEAFWRWLLAAGPGAASAITAGLGGLCQLFEGAARDLAPKLEALWRWLQAAALVALPYALAVAALLLLAALVWFCWAALCPALSAAGLAVCKALVWAACCLGYGLCFVGARCLQCCAVVTMKAPGAAGFLISRAAFLGNPALYFGILHAAGSVVASAVFCVPSVASAVAAPVAALFGVSVGA